MDMKFQIKISISGYPVLDTVTDRKLFQIILWFWKFTVTDVRFLNN